LDTNSLDFNSTEHVEEGTSLQPTHKGKSWLEDRKNSLRAWCKLHKRYLQIAAVVTSAAVGTGLWIFAYFTSSKTEEGQLTENPLFSINTTVTPTPFPAPYDPFTLTFSFDTPYQIADFRGGVLSFEYWKQFFGETSFIYEYNEHNHALHRFMNELAAHFPHYNLFEWMIKALKRGDALNSFMFFCPPGANDTALTELTAGYKFPWHQIDNSSQRITFSGEEINLEPLSYLFKGFPGNALFSGGFCDAIFGNCGTALNYWLKNDLLRAVNATVKLFWYPQSHYE
jgi:hypothetical protein